LAVGVRQDCPSFTPLYDVSVKENTAIGRSGMGKVMGKN
jgi:hypothetical protein